MTLILERPDNKEAALKAKARQQGVSAESYAAQVFNRDLEEPADSTAKPEERGRQFHTWAESHDRNTPLLSDEANQP
jgi:hypothetical protein